jgi:hypothetical protein
MKTETTVPETAIAPPPPPATAPKPRIASAAKTATATLRGVDGSVMTIVAERKADESARTYVLLCDATKKTTRGCTETHTSFEAARKAISIRAAEAEKLGWYRKPTAHFFTAKADAFAALPPAPKAAPKAAEAKK